MVVAVVVVVVVVVGYDDKKDRLKVLEEDGWDRMDLGIWGFGDWGLGCGGCKGCSVTHGTGVRVMMMMGRAGRTLWDFLT